MSDNTSDQPVPSKKGSGFIFVSKVPYWKSKKKYSNHGASGGQRRRSSSARAEIFQVMAKVRKHPEYKELDDNQAQELADNLISLEYFRNQFSAFNEHHVEDVLDNIRFEADSSLDMHESGAAATRATVRLAEMGNINIKLQLRELKVWNQGVFNRFASHIATEYGPTHAALLIGNKENGYVILEWDGTSLIDPQYYHPESCEGVLFEANVATQVSTVDRRLHEEVRIAGQELDYERQIDLVFDAAVERSKVFDDLFKLVIKYNKFHYYHLFSRNCQHFVVDAMKALKIQNPHAFTGRLKAYYDKIRKGRAAIDFQSHSQLDAHVTTRISEATQQELEYYMCMYLHFHAVSRSQSSETDPTKWKCQETACQFDNVDTRIAEQEIVLNDFLPQSSS